MGYIDSTSIDVLDKAYNEEKDGKIKSRILMVTHKKQGFSYRQIGKFLRMPHCDIWFWVRRFDKEGFDGLYMKEGRGRKGYLTKEQKALVIQFIEKNNPTSKEINDYLKKKFGVSYHPFAIQKLIKKLNFSRITPRKRYQKADKEKQEEWKSIFKKRYGNGWHWAYESSSRTNQ